MANIQHSMSQTTEYRVWCSMKTRCLNKKADNYYLYGRRGITVCSSWLHSFTVFYSDMGKRPQGTTLDRIDNNKGYSKANCRWAGKYDQANNKRNNRVIKWKDMELTLQQWADTLEVPRARLENRLDRLGWTVEEVLFIPKNMGRKQYYGRYDRKA